MPAPAPSTTQDLFPRQNKPSGALSPRSTNEVRTAWDKLKAIFSKKPKGKEISFPPPTWFEDGHVMNPGASEAAANPAFPIPDGKDGDSPSEGDGSDPLPPALWIAQKVQELTLHLPNSSLINAQSRPPVDPKLAKLLGTAYVMNGSISRGRKSVWATLEKLPPLPLGQQLPDSGEDKVDVIGGTIMLYSPILPSSEDVVELASSHIEVISTEVSVKETGTRAHSWPWPFSKWSKTASTETTDQPSKVRVWEPSLTKLSAHVMWWGYRLYLPPPVMAVISDEYTEVSQRAALITAALSWLVDHIPVSILPPPLRPVILVLQTIIPYVGYIGAFIAWSWGAIKQFDKGHGITLTATWLLPVALIPAAWNMTSSPSGKVASPSGVPASLVGGSIVSGGTTHNPM